MVPVLMSPCVSLQMAGRTGAKPHQQNSINNHQVFWKGWGLS